MASTGKIAVLDFGKTNVKLSVADRDGHILESRATPNVSEPGPPWQHNNLRGLSEWVFDTLAALCRRHPIAHVVPTGHGSGGVLVAADPDANGDGLALPMIDYEQPMPAKIDQDYVPMSGSFLDRGSALLHGSTHAARQLYRMECEAPEGFALGRWYLNVAQYWAWRLSGVAVSEATGMGAQSHLWNVARGDWSPIVAARGWQRLLPDFAPAWARLGLVRTDLARRHGLPRDLAVHAGGHDSSLNFYRYAASGLAGFTVLSTGTWIVAQSDLTDPADLDEARGMCLNADVNGRPVGGALTMGGREFSRIAGEGWQEARADLATMAALVGRGTFALPGFGDGDGQFPGTAGKGRIAGQAPADAGERRSLAVLTSALLARECAGVLADHGAIVLDGAFLNEPLFAPLTAALFPGRPVLVSAESTGVSTGAALLVGHETRQEPAPASLSPARAVDLPQLAAYAAAWRRDALRGSAAG